MAKAPADIRSLARSHTATAIKTLSAIMTSPKAPPSARVAAASVLLDRGHGKAVQHIEAEISVYDSLGLAEQEALLAALDMLAEGGVIVTDPIEVKPARLIGGNGLPRKQ